MHRKVKELYLTSSLRIHNAKANELIIWLNGSRTFRSSRTEMNSDDKAIVQHSIECSPIRFW